MYYYIKIVYLALLSARWSEKGKNCPSEGQPKEEF